MTLDDRDALALLDDFATCWIVVGFDGDIRWANRAAAELLGSSVDELVGDRIHERFPDAAATGFRANFEALVARGGRVEYEEYLPSLDLWVHVEAVRRDDAVLASFRDITERRRRESSLQLLLDQQPAITWAVDRDLRFTSIAGTARAAVPIDRGAQVGMRLALVAPRDVVEAHRRALDGDAVDHDIVMDDRVFAARLEPVRASSGDVVGVAGVAIDVTAQRAAAEELHESEQLYRLIVENADHGIWLIDGNDYTTFVNDKLARLVGYEPGEMIGRTPYAFVPEGAAERAAGTLERLRQGRPDAFEFTLLRRNGSEIDVEMVTSPLFDADGRYSGALALVTDVTEKRAAQRALAESERRFRSVFDGANEALILLDDDNRFVDVNEAACRLFGRSRRELVGERSHDVGAASDEITIERRDGSERFVWRGAPARVLPGLHLVVLRDVTDQKALEAQLRQAQKMEAIGRIAGGVAHDFNNVLSAIFGLSETVIARGGESAADAEEILRAASRASDLVRQLLAFSRQQILERRVLDVNDVIADVERIVARTIGADVEISCDLDPDLRPVRADAGQLQQVILNLAVNARDAMPDGGTLTLRTRNVLVGDDGQLPPGGYVELTVSDTGVGIGDEVREHIFEPFFTTKAAGEGSGLGLSTVYGIVRQSGGQIRVASEPGAGTAFTVLLPASTDEIDVAPTPETPQPGAASETILLVEDEPVVRQLVREILERDGYAVLEAADPEAAIATSKDSSFDLLLTDVVLPRMSGPDIARAVTATQDDVKVLYMSGYSDTAAMDRGLGQPGTAFIQKPFRAQELSAKVRALLETA